LNRAQVVRVCGCEREVPMTRAKRNELLKRAVAKLEEASKLLKSAQEGLLAEQANELADFVDVLTPAHEEAA
jgi:hypothetical protein